MQDDRMTPSQTIGMLIIVFTAGIPGLHLAGFWSGTSVPLAVWVLVAALGGIVGGLLMAAENRVAGAVGGLFAGPLGLIAIYMYCRNRETVHNVELVFVQGIGSLPGVGVYFLVRFLVDAVFPAEVEEEEPDERPRRRRRRDEDEDVDDQPRRRRDRGEELEVVDDAIEEPRPRRRRQPDLEPPSPKRRRRTPAEDE